MKILGISAFYHDSAAALVVDGAIVAAAQEERFTRKKNDPSFPVNAIKFVCDYSGYSLDDLDAVVFYDKPFLKFERLLETYYDAAPGGLASFVQSMPAWIKEKLFLRKVIKDGLREAGASRKKKFRLLFPEHHLSHAASAFYPSPFDEAAILTIDGVGEWATASICSGNGSRITVLKELHYPHSAGLLYAAFTYYCGFKVNSGEYKLMGLAPYGNPHSETYGRCVSVINSHLVDLKEDGSLFLNQDYFSYSTSLRMVDDAKWSNLFGFGRRHPEQAVEQQYCDMALAIQTFIEEVVIRMAREAARLTGSRRLCMAGGLALNCVANGKLRELGIFDELFIQPAAGDAGGALGAALAASNIYFHEKRQVSIGRDAMQGSCLGPAFSDEEIRRSVARFNPKFSMQDNIESTAAASAALIAAGNIVGWFQGRMEFGPRALGARSILADPRYPDMQQKINEKIKFREGFRPFAPSILLEDATQIFETRSASPYMSLVVPIQPAEQFPQPSGYEAWPMTQKLNFRRSRFPAITHVDYTARVQTVDDQSNPAFRRLLLSFKEQTGTGLLINTSFNVRGEPIVNSPVDAYKCFMNSGMDYLVMGNIIFDKREQSPWVGEMGPRTFEAD